jgi:HD-GYP domain-containing protein (c-di-GMP phosphodiesterase class II)
VSQAAGNSVQLEWPSTTRIPGAVDTACDALERFIQVLQETKRVADQYHAALSAICEGTGAQLAFLYSDQLGRVLETAGDPVSKSHWYRDFCKRLVTDLPRGGLWKAPSHDRLRGGTTGLEPLSAAMLPVEAPRPAWMVAVSFDDDRPLGQSELRVMQVIWRLQLGQNRHAVVHDNLKETLFGVVRCLSTAIDAKDHYTCGHSERVARIAVRLGEEMKLSRGEISDLYLAGLLHDVGKIGIRDEVLLKEGPLTAVEFAHIKEHPVTGERIVSNVTRLDYLRPGVRGHHERFDGKGYPDGLRGEAIPLMARILSVADACDAMMSPRRYRNALEPPHIEETMRLGSGTQWDPFVVQCFFACRLELYAVCQRGLGQSVYMAVERAANGDSGRSHANAKSGLGR